MYIKRQGEVSLRQGTCFRYTRSKFTAYREKDGSINMPRKASIQQRIRMGEAKSCDLHIQGRVHHTSVTESNACLFWKQRQHCLALGSSLLGFRISFMILLDEALPLLNCLVLHVSPWPAWEKRIPAWMLWILSTSGKAGGQEMPSQVRPAICLTHCGTFLYCQQWMLQKETWNVGSWQTAGNLSFTTLLWRMTLLPFHYQQ